MDKKSTVSTHCTWCSAINCSNSKNKRPDLTFFRFPLDLKSSKRWVINCRRADLDNKCPTKLHKNNFLCEVHFESSCFRNTNRKLLYKDAVPTLFDVPNPPKRLESSRTPTKFHKNTVSSIFPSTIKNIADNHSYALNPLLDPYNSTSPCLVNSSSVLSVNIPLLQNEVKSPQQLVNHGNCKTNNLKKRSSLKLAEESSNSPQEDLPSDISDEQSADPSKSCCVLGCINRLEGNKLNINSTSISFHNFPINDPERLKIWMNSINRKDPITGGLWKPDQFDCICNEHFTPEVTSINHMTGKLTLKSSAVPTLFLEQPQEHIKQHVLQSIDRSRNSSKLLQLIKDEKTQKPLKKEAISNNHSYTDNNEESMLKRLREELRKKYVVLHKIEQRIEEAQDELKILDEQTLSLMDTEWFSNYEGSSEINDMGEDEGLTPSDYVLFYVA